MNQIHKDGASHGMSLYFFAHDDQRRGAPGPYKIASVSSSLLI